jgi:hypothetical protein
LRLTPCCSARSLIRSPDWYCSSQLYRSQTMLDTLLKLGASWLFARQNVTYVVIKVLPMS